MTALWQSLGQLVVGFVLVGIPFLAGALWQAGRTRVWRDRAYLSEDRYEDLLDLTAATSSAAPHPHRRLSVVPDACRSCGSVGWHHEGCRVLGRLDAGEVRA